MNQQPGESAAHDQYLALGSDDALPFVNASMPNVARIYDYLLGGKDNYSADREAAVGLMRLIPDALAACRHNRHFLKSAVEFLAGEAGIRQFIDIGTGLPTQGNVHEIACGIDPDARVLYADYDPVVVSHAQALLASDKSVVAINGDLRRPDGILGSPELRALINLEEPVAVLLVAVLHFITDDENPYAIVGKLKAAMAPGSYLVLSHITADEVPCETSLRAQDVYQRATAPASPRSHAAITGFFHGLEILEPGVADVCAWRTGHQPLRTSRTLIYAGVAKKSAQQPIRSGDMP
jgi:hypothetical protein